MVKDAQSIQDLLSESSKQWNPHYAKAFSVSFSEDADFTNAQTFSAHDGKEIEKLHKKPITSRFKNCILKITDKKIPFVTADTTSVDAWRKMPGARTGKARPLENGCLILS